MDPLTISIEILLLFFFIAAVAGFIDTLAGGGGLITIPALMIAGVPPLSALATNKLQGSMGTATATFSLIKDKRLKWKNVKALMPFALLGSALGTLIIHLIDPKVLSFLIPVVLVFISLYFLLAKSLSEGTKQPRVSDKTYRRFVIPFIGGYDGALGPGTGSFFALAGTSLAGLSLVQATALAKPLNFASNFASLAIFLFAGNIIWLIGLVMMAGQAVGAFAGSKYLFKIHPQLLRGCFVFMCVAMLVKFAVS